MDALAFMTEMLSLPAIRDILSENHPNIFNTDAMDHNLGNLIEVDRWMRRTDFSVLAEGTKRAIIEDLREAAHKVGTFTNEIIGHASKKQFSSSQSNKLRRDWELIQHSITEIIFRQKRWDVKKDRNNILRQFKDALTGNKREITFHETTNSSNCKTLNEKQSLALLLKKAIPSITELKSSVEIKTYANELYTELYNLPQLICQACEGHSQAVILIGNVLSLKERAYGTWNMVKDDLVKIRVSNNCVASNHMWPIFTYCYNDLPDDLQKCFLYFACYPIGYEISTTSMTEIWIAEGFVTPKEEETIEETAYNYLEQLVQRSLVCISKRSFSGTIKCFRVPHSIHEFVIQQSCTNGFLVANPDQEQIRSLFRIAIHHDNKKQYIEDKNNHILSFLAFGVDRNVLLESAVLLRVLALRKCTIPLPTIPSMFFLRYLCLRDNNIFELPQNIEDMKNLETLDVRDTRIEILPESLWNISTLRHVYVKPSSQIKGPPSSAKISALQILKTVEAHDSWKEKIPYFLIHLRKLALSNWDNIDWKFISNLLSHMEKLISMEFIGKIIPSEYADTRAFPNLKTVKSMKLEGEWNCRKLIIDHVKFPLNLAKLTLTNSALTEDPMPALGRLQALKFLSLQNGAYRGKQMVCSANGFPQLQFLELSKLENLEIWEVELTAMSRLSRLHVDQCRNLNDLPNLHCVIIVNDTDDDADHDIYTTVERSISDWC